MTFIKVFVSAWIQLFFLAGFIMLAIGALLSLLEYLDKEPGNYSE